MTWARCVAFGLLGLLLVLRADAIAAEDRFEIRSAYVELREGVYLLNAQLDFDLPARAREAIDDGLPLSLQLEIIVDRRRRLWPDETVATLEQRYEIGFHALSERYLVRNLNSGEQQSFPTLDAALDALSVIRDLPILDRSLVAPDLRYEVNLRATLDVRSMPEAMRFLLFWVDSFKQTSEWYTWPLSL
ncbi:MAG TPA: DUF4390 domain-containing protein [Steroidobacteraceae bacterium]|nr:DUF4390 domain-containing protein [Steroidobacteraceae bacterium]